MKYNYDRWKWYAKACHSMALDLGLEITEENGKVFINGELPPETTRYPWLAVYHEVSKRWEAEGYKLKNRKF